MLNIDSRNKKRDHSSTLTDFLKEGANYRADILKG